MNDPRKFPEKFEKGEKPGKNQSIKGKEGGKRKKNRKKWDKYDILI